MQIAICEDELFYRNAIQEKIALWSQNADFHGIHVIPFESSEDFFYQWKTGMEIDLIFLDIQFHNEMDGMELAHRIRETDANVAIVFISNFEAYLSEGYTVNAMRYLSKPVKYEDIAICLEIVSRQYTLSHDKYFVHVESGGRLAVRYNDILYFEARSPYTYIYTYDKASKIRLRFADVLEKVPTELFITCHRSYIANLAHIRNVRKNELTLSNQATLPISKPYADALGRAFDHYYLGGGI
ncbi:MAG: LytTR family DNA-binding domain-containing protein [Clostridia bacterium]